MRARLRGQKTSYHHGDLRRGLMDAAITLIDIRAQKAQEARVAAAKAAELAAAEARFRAETEGL